MSVTSSGVNYWDYPFVGFSFSVMFISPLLVAPQECNFQEVSGLNVTLDTEEIKEGGENSFSHRIPSRPKYQNLVLKRGMFKMIDSALIIWMQACIATFSFNRISVLVSLLDETRAPLAVWSVVNAYPVGIKVADFKSTDNAVVVETLEFAYDYILRTL